MPSNKHKKNLTRLPSWPKSLQKNSLKHFLKYFCGLSLVCFSWMQSVFVIITKLIASKNHFCKEFFFVIILAAMVFLFLRLFLASRGLFLRKTQQKIVRVKSQRFSYAFSQIATLPSVVAPNRSSKSQIAARYAAFWHAISQIALASFLLCP